MEAGAFTQKACSTSQQGKVQPKLPHGHARQVSQLEPGNQSTLEARDQSWILVRTAKLERLHKVVRDEHDKRRQQASVKYIYRFRLCAVQCLLAVEAETCGMNLRRKADLAAIKAESSLPDVEVLSIHDGSLAKKPWF